MAISKLKKRFGVSLSIKQVDRFETLCKELGLTNMSMSALFEDALIQTSNLMQTLKEKGTLTLDDLKRLQGQQMELLEKEDGKDVGNIRNVRKESKRNQNSGS